MTREIKRFIYVIAALLLIASIFIYLPADMRHWGFLIFGLALVIPFVIWQTAWEKFLEKLPRPFNLPSTEARFRIWQKTYSIIKPLRVQKSKWGYVIAILETQHPDLPHDQNTLKDILDAGDAGCLQSWPIDIEACREKKRAKNRKS